jgi:hypothetical protein
MLLNTLDLHNLQDIHPMLQTTQPVAPFPELPILDAWACAVPGCAVVRTSQQRLLRHLYDNHNISSMRERKESMVVCNTQALNKHSYLFQ